MHRAGHIFGHIPVGDLHQLRIILHLAQNGYADNVLHLVGTVLVDLTQRLKQLFNICLPAGAHHFQHPGCTVFGKEGLRQKLAVGGNIALDLVFHIRVQHAKAVGQGVHIVADNTVLGLGAGHGLGHFDFVQVCLFLLSKEGAHFLTYLVGYGLYIAVVQCVQLKQRTGDGAPLGVFFLIGAVKFQQLLVCYIMQAVQPVITGKGQGVLRACLAVKVQFGIDGGKLLFQRCKSLVQFHMGTPYSVIFTWCKVL